MTHTFSPVALKILRRCPHVVSRYARRAEGSCVVLSQRHFVTSVVPVVRKEKRGNLQNKKRSMNYADNSLRVISCSGRHGSHFDSIADLLACAAQPSSKLRSNIVCLHEFPLDTFKLIDRSTKIPLLSVEVSYIFVQKQKLVLNPQQTLSNAHDSRQGSFIPLFCSLFLLSSAISFTVHVNKSASGKSQHTRPQRLVAVNPLEHHNAPPPAKESVSDVYASSRANVPFDQIKHQPNGETYRGKPRHISPSPTHMRPLNVIGALKRDSVKEGA